MPSIKKISFAGGEIAPALHARIDLTKYMTGLKTCLNWMIMRHGGATTRPGTGFTGEIKDSSKVVRLIPFIFNDDQTYVLEFGDLYMRIIQNGAQVTETAQTITGANQADPCVITIAGHGYSNGEEVYITSVGGMIELNVRNFKVANKTTDTFELQEMDGTDLDSTGYTAFTSGGTAARVYTITTPYLEADLATLEFTQSADVITITHPTYPPKELARSALTTWTLITIVYGAQIDAPLNPVSAGPGTVAYYKVTAVDAITNEESLPSVSTGSANETSILTWDDVENAGQYNIYKLFNGVYGWIGVSTPETTGFTAVTLTTLTWSGGVVTATKVGHGFSTDDFLLIEAADQLGYNGLYKITAPDADTFTYAVEDTLETPATGTVTATETKSQFDDESFDADVLDTPPVDRQPFDGEGNFPSTVAHYQQRLVFANTTNDTEGVWTSKSTLPKNFMSSTPIQADDAVTFSLFGREVNAIKHLLEVDGRLVLFTSSAEWSVKGDGAGILTPSSINPDQHTYNGSGDLRPLVVDDTAIYVQARGSVVRDIGYNFDSDGYKGNELSIFAAHMFDKYTLVDWDYQQIPHSIAWVVRSDGILLGLTYIREHQVVAWHRHEFSNGTVENVVVVPEGNEDVLYLLIKRTINGKVVRYIEHMKTRQITDIEDYVGMDSSLSYDGTNTTAITMTVSGGSTWAYDEDLTLIASASYFASTDIDDEIVFGGVQFKINAFTSDTIVTVKPSKTVPSAIRDVATATWSKALLEVTGLWHLEGEDISAFVDGYVSASPNNDTYDIKTVTNGTVTLDDPHSVIHIGLPITADLETLPLDSLQSETMSDKKKHVSHLMMSVEETMGLFVGPDTDNLTELKQRDFANMPDDVIVLITGVAELNIDSNWNDTGALIIRQIDPVPASVLAVTPSGYISG